MLLIALVMFTTTVCAAQCAGVSCRLSPAKAPDVPSCHPQSSKKQAEPDRSCTASVFLAEAAGNAQPISVDTARQVQDLDFPALAAEIMFVSQSHAFHCEASPPQLGRSVFSTVVRV